MERFTLIFCLGLSFSGAAAKAAAGFQGQKCRGQSISVAIGMGIAQELHMELHSKK